MEFNIMKNNNFDMIYININEGAGEKNFFIRNSGNGTKNILKNHDIYFYTKLIIETKKNIYIIYFI